MTDSFAPQRRSLLIAFLLYVFLAVALTWPLAAAPATHLPSGDDDLFQNYWNFWWWKVALIERHQSPYQTDLLFHPEGAPLGFHTHSEANQIVALPANILFGEAAALNMSILAGFVLAGFGAFLLARAYTVRAGPAFLAGVVFAFLPQHVEQSLEHLNLASIQGIPLVLWAIVRQVRLGGRSYLLTGAFFSLNCLYGWHNGLMTVPFGAALALYEMKEHHRPFRETAAGFLKAAGIASLLLAPFIWPMIRDVLEKAGRFRKPPAPRAIDPLFLLVPHPGHPFWGSLFAGLYERMRGYASVGFIGYLGIITVVLASMAFLKLGSGGPGGGASAEGLRSQRRAAWLWLGLAVFFLLLSFGKTLTVAGQEYPRIPMPFRIACHIPFFSRVRVPHRFLVPASLCLAVLAAIGAERITSRLRRSRGNVTAILIALVVLDFLWLPYPMREVPKVPWIEMLSDLPEGLAVLDIPSGHRARGADDMFLQTLHGRPIAGGYVSIPIRHVSERLLRYPVLRRIFQSEETDSGYDGPNLITAIRGLDVGIVVVHLDRTPDAIRARREEAVRLHPGEPYRLLAYEPEEGMPQPLMDRLRAELREAYGEPTHRVTGSVEIYLTRPSPPDQ